VRALLASLVVLGLAGAGHAQDEPGSAVRAVPEASGTHLRLNTDRGAIHLWFPEGYEPMKAGLVVYLHGYYTNVDRAWQEYGLASQFQSSGRNALFIAPEAPDSWNQEVQWPTLTPLINVVEQWAHLPMPRGPVVVMGHSGAFRTIVPWLREPRVQDVILLDALYHNERDFYWWLLHAPGHMTHHLTLVAAETLAKAQHFVQKLGRVPQRASIPVDYADFTPTEAKGRLLLLRSQYEHMELVTSGKVIPILLHLPAIPGLPGAARTSAAAASGTR